ncbi:uncharacterized protein BJ171DRAFT_30576 [Polychytrium aggregatum]|uniref:uncharacterized protein n=1 Tax=Polychytrium aggregatum TaxID=110093 RepID=UPI0022FE430B|nr:uncharacterized protein BJ171DRAFT_30576 [Polychytrium aggregatum]KAI9206445.1 hypothetical protein BJ171DRAFT_30576 [Polychytrium aggregatum]
MSTTSSAGKPTGASKVINILLLGETGVGKSTFINAIANYLTYETLNLAASGNNVISLIPTKFWQDKGVDEWVEITEKRLNVEDENRARENEGLKLGQSSTRSACTYRFIHDNGDQSVEIRIIDTPGMGDTRGFSQDKQNVDHTINYIANYPEIHAVLILLRSDSVKLNTWFRYCIQELIGNLHRDCLKNMYFIFTHSKLTNGKLGEGFLTLKSYLEELEQEYSVEIPMSRSNTFAIDNESYRYLLAKGDIVYEDRYRKGIEESWKHARSTVYKLLEQISNKTTHETKLTVILYNCRQLVNRNYKVWLQALANVSGNLQGMEKVAEQMSKGKIGNMDKILEYTIYTPVKRETCERPQLVCTVAGCYGYIINEDGTTSIRYKTDCHNHLMKLIKKKADAQASQQSQDAGNATQPEPSSRAGAQVHSPSAEPSLDELLPGELPSSLIFWYPSMNSWGYCKECGHWFMWHQKCTVNYTYVQKCVFNDEQMKLIKSEQNSTKRIDHIKKSFAKSKDNLSSEAAHIRQLLAKIAVTIEKGGIISYNDAFLKYMDELITSQEGSLIPSSVAGETTPEDNRTYLLRQKAEYEEQRKLLLEMKQAVTTTIESIEELINLIDELSHLRYIGDYISEHTIKLDIKPPTFETTLHYR